MSTANGVNLVVRKSKSEWVPNGLFSVASVMLFSLGSGILFFLGMSISLRGTGFSLGFSNVTSLVPSPFSCDSLVGTVTLRNVTPVG